MIHISKGGDGDFSTVQAALDSIPVDNKEEMILFIHKGIYEEQITVKPPHITFIEADQRIRDSRLYGTGAGIRLCDEQLPLYKLLLPCTQRLSGASMAQFCKDGIDQLLYGAAYSS